jgi:DNA-binding SARP family transcriptional activator
LIEFSVLGPVEALVGAEPLPLGGAKQRALLAVLLVHAEQIVSVEVLIDELWSDNPPPSAPHTLEAYISRLRGLLAPYAPSLVRRGGGYVLELHGAALDARVFERLLEELSLAAAQGDHPRASDLGADALALWRGPALAGVAVGPLAKAEAERLEELRLRVLEQRFEAELALGRHEERISELQLAVANNPFRERFTAQLMLALYRSGRHADALELYEKTRSAMGDELGLQPSA